MHITRVYVSNLPPLHNVEFDCDEHVNLFIGSNASGKSTILRAIRSLDSLSSALSSEEHEGLFYSSKDGDDRVIAEPSYDWLKELETLIFDYPLWHSMPILYIPPTRINLPPQDIFSQTIKRPEPYGYDLTWNDIFNRHFGNYVGDFVGEYVEAAFPYLRTEIGTNRSHQNQLMKARNLGDSCAKSICDEVIYGNESHDYVEVRDEYDAEEHEDGFYPTGRITHYGMGIRTEDDITDEPLYAGALSSGTQGTLLWIRALAYKMARHYNWEEGWEEKPAILLIDEIENHLHPTWQRRVIPALLEHFPKLQIFATTHSPFVVAGLKAGQVHLLKRDENGRVTATPNDKDIVGWTMDEILRTMMGVDDPTDDATAAAAQELRQLRNEWPRSSPEEEEKRQERIAELRQKVDRDLLAGGPLAAQREEFAKRFAEALEKHGIPKNLNLENG